jgi:hypothetical protein
VSNSDNRRKMAKNPIDLRRKRYFKLSSHIAQLNNSQLRSLLSNGEINESSTGWGTNQTIFLEPFQVFVKHIPVTTLEYENLFSTKNLYHLPTSYHYGIDSTGLGVFRELLAHIRTTHWVLDEAIASFPLMYHYRIMPFSGQCVDVETGRWGNHPNVLNYVLDRANASYELVLFLEYIPYVLETWLWENPNQLQNSLDQICKTIAFLRTKGIIHFDAHFRNILTDGEQVYLTDFGLALDKSFALTKDEEDFFERNTFYDYGEVLRNLGHLIRSPYYSCLENDKRKMMEKHGITEGLQPYEVGAILLDNIEQIHADGDLALDEFYVASIVKYRSIIALMQNFFAKMWGNAKKDTELPYAELQQLLKKTGFLSRYEN